MDERATGQPIRFEHYRVATDDQGRPLKLGEGAMGVTYLAEDTNLKVRVALKVIRPQLLGDAEVGQRFQREAQAAARLRHPNVAGVYHLGMVDNTFFYAMEFVEGETLKDRVQRGGPMPIKEALEVTLQVCEALGAAEKHKMVHRDIKPANIMLELVDDDLLRVKLIDFGLAKPLHAEAQNSMALQTQAGIFLGTPVFASPEQVQDVPPDSRSDFYALGLTLWFMLEGRTPFEGSLHKVLFDQVHTIPPLGRLLWVPAEVRDLLGKMLEKEPANRPQTARELRQKIHDCLRALATSGTSYTEWQQRFQVEGKPHSKPWGMIYEGQDTLSGAVRLHLLRHDRFSDPKALQGVIGDARRAIDIHHPNILRHLTVFPTSGGQGAGWMVVTEHPGNQTLLDHLRKVKQMPAAETIAIVERLASAIDTCIASDLITADLDPSGIFLKHVPRTEIHALSSSASATASVTATSTSITSPTAETFEVVPKLSPINYAVLTTLRPADETAIGLTQGPFRTEATTPEELVQRLALLAYQCLGGAVPSTWSRVPRFIPLASLTQRQNDSLRAALVESTWTRATDFVEAFRQTKAAVRHKTEESSRITTSAEATVMLTSWRMLADLAAGDSSEFSTEHAKEFTGKIERQENPPAEESPAEAASVTSEQKEAEAPVASSEPIAESATQPSGELEAPASMSGTSTASLLDSTLTTERTQTWSRTSQSEATAEPKSVALKSELSPPTAPPIPPTPSDASSVSESPSQTEIARSELTANDIETVILSAGRASSLMAIPPAPEAKEDAQDTETISSANEVETPSAESLIETPSEAFTESLSEKETAKENKGEEPTQVSLKESALSEEARAIEPEAAAAGTTLEEEQKEEAPPVADTNAAESATEEDSQATSGSAASPATETASGEQIAQESSHDFQAEGADFTDCTDSADAHASSITEDEPATTTASAVSSTTAQGFLSPPPVGDTSFSPEDEPPTISPPQVEEAAPKITTSSSTTVVPLPLSGTSSPSTSRTKKSPATTAPEGKPRWVLPAIGALAAMALIVGAFSIFGGKEEINDPSKPPVVVTPPEPPPPPPGPSVAELLTEAGAAADAGNIAKLDEALAKMRSAAPEKSWDIDPGAEAFRQKMYAAYRAKKLGDDSAGVLRKYHEIFLGAAMARDSDLELLKQISADLSSPEDTALAEPFEKAVLSFLDRDPARREEKINVALAYIKKRPNSVVDEAARGFISHELEKCVDYLEQNPRDQSQNEGLRNALDALMPRMQEFSAVGIPEAWYILGDQALKAQHPDPVLAMNYFGKAADEDHAQSMRRYGIALTHRFAGREPDMVGAAEYLRQAVAKGDLKANVFLADIYLPETPSASRPRKAKEAYDLLTTAAKEDSPEAHYLLGSMLLDYPADNSAHGFAPALKNPDRETQAMGHLEKAVAAKVPRAYLRLANALFARKKITEAVATLEAGTALDPPEAKCMYHLSMILSPYPPELPAEPDELAAANVRADAERSRTLYDRSLAILRAAAKNGDQEAIAFCQERRISFK